MVPAGPPLSASSCCSWPWRGVSCGTGRPASPSWSPSLLAPPRARHHPRQLAPVRRPHRPHPRPHRLVGRAHRGGGRRSTWSWLSDLGRTPTSTTALVVALSTLAAAHLGPLPAGAPAPQPVRQPGRLRRAQGRLDNVLRTFGSRLSRARAHGRAAAPGGRVCARPSGSRRPRSGPARGPLRADRLGADLPDHLP